MEEVKQRTALAKIIRERRAVKKHYTDKPVTERAVLDLLEDAIWAPTHQMRQPWRFVFVSSEKKADFAKKVAATYPEEKQQNREDYMNEPNAVLVVIMDRGENEKQYDENFGATACMIQNFWLLAWEQQLGVVWKTNPHIYDEHVGKVLGVSDNEKIVGFLHLGYFDKKPIIKDRTPVVEKFTRYEG